MSRKTVLVTGASGFTGRYLVPALQRAGFRVAGLGQGTGSAADVEQVCDLSDAGAVRAAVQAVRPHYVVHLAALAFVGHGDPLDFYRVNVLGTLNLLEALDTLAERPEKVVVASSANVYGRPDREVLTEETCPAPVNHYACSKLSMEHLVRNWFDRLPVVIARPFNYTGIGQDGQFLVPKIVRHFRQKEPRMELGNLEVSRDFLDVRDVALAYVALLESGCHSEVYNVCSGTAISLKTILETAGRLAGHPLEVTVNPAYVRRDEIAILRGSPAKLAEATGFAPRYRFEDTLAWMLQEKMN